MFFPVLVGSSKRNLATLLCGVKLTVFNFYLVRRLGEPKWLKCHQDDRLLLAVPELDFGGYPDWKACFWTSAVTQIGKHVSESSLKYKCGYLGQKVAYLCGFVSGTTIKCRPPKMSTIKMPKRQNVDRQNVNLP
jgi:hypothetical protein